jgi:long-chain fatty acid transport protein
MKKSQVFKRTLLAVTVAIATQQAHAAGFQLNAQSATGLGRAFAGDAVIADNASAMSRNAAAMSLFDKTEFSVGVNAISTDISVTDTTYHRTPSNINAGFAGFDASTSIDDANNGGTSYVPNIYIVVPINDKWAIGGGIYSNFGTSHEFASDYGSGTGHYQPGIIPPSGDDLALPGADAFGGTTNVSTINYALAASYRVNDQWSLGLGLDIITGSGELTRSTNFQGTATSTTLLDVDASGTGIGWNAGVVYEMNDHNRFGFSYHYSPEVEASGHVEYSQDDDIGDLILPLPSMAEFSGYHHLRDTSFAVHYSVQWIQWSAFEKLSTTDGVDMKTYEWQDAMHYSIGGTYYINNNWEARIGYMYDTSAQDKITSISVPDSDRQWFSAGASYHINDNSSVDLGFTYLVGQDTEVTDNLVENVVYVDATTRADAMLFGIQYSHSF